MKHSWLKVVLLSTLGFVTAVDISHWVLNRIFDPFTGPWDTAIHFVLLATSVFYFGVCVWGCFQFAKWFDTTKFLSEGCHASFILLALIAGELAFTLLTHIRSGSSSYHPLFPDFLSGLVLATTTMAAGREHLRSRIGRMVVVLVAFFWLAGNVTVDLLWLTERTSRGVGPVWHLPLIGPLLVAISYFFIFGGHPLEVCLNFPETIFKAGPVIQSVWFFVLVVMLAWCLRWLTPSRAWLKSLALGASVVFLAFKAVEWSSFIAD